LPKATSDDDISRRRSFSLNSAPPELKLQLNSQSVYVGNKPIPVKPPPTNLPPPPPLKIPTLDALPADNIEPPVSSVKETVSPVLPQPQPHEEISQPPKSPNSTGYTLPPEITQPSQPSKPLLQSSSKGESININIVKTIPQPPSHPTPPPPRGTTGVKDIASSLNIQLQNPPTRRLTSSPSSTPKDEKKRSSVTLTKTTTKEEPKKGALPTPPQPQVNLSDIKDWKPVKPGVLNRSLTVSSIKNPETNKDLVEEMSTLSGIHKQVTF
jgi:hypothetical protein